MLAGEIIKMAWLALEFPLGTGGNKFNVLK